MARTRSKSTQVLIETCPVPEDMVLAAARRLVECSIALRQLADETKRMNLSWSMRRERLEKEIADLSTRVSGGNIEAATSCFVEYDFDTGTRYVIHPGTGNVISEVPMSPSDWIDARAQGIAPKE